MATPPSAQQRHAHFLSDEEDSGEDSPPGLQLPTRLRAHTILRPTHGHGKDSSNDTTTSTRASAANALSLQDVHHNGSDRPSSAMKRQMNSETSPAPERTDDVLPPTSPPVVKRARVRMNSQPVTVSMPAIMARSNGQTDDIPSEEVRGRPQTRDTSPPMDIHEQPVEAIGEKIPTRRLSSARTDTLVSSHNKEEHPTGDGSHQSQRSSSSKRLWRIYNNIKSSHRVSWILPTITNYNLMKPVIRSSISAWIGLVFLLINPILRVEGQSAFFSVVVAFISPPSLPLVQAMEQIIYLWVFVGLAWAWVAICAACISAVRTNYVNPTFLAQVERKFAGLKATNPEQYQRRIVSDLGRRLKQSYSPLFILQIFEGTYIQAKPAVFCAVFLAIGTAALVREILASESGPV